VPVYRSDNRQDRIFLCGTRRPIDDDPEDVAQSLYQLWLGASVMAKIVRRTLPFETAMRTTRLLLRLAL